MGRYEDFLDSLQQQQRGQQLHDSLAGAVGTNADDFARMQQLARQTGVDVVSRPEFKPEAEQLAYLRQNNVSRLQNDAPKVADFVSNPNNAKLAHDDLENMRGLERTFLGTLGDVGVVAAKSVVGLPQAFVGIADIPTFGYTGKALEAAGLRFNETQRILDGLYSPAQQKANKAVREADGFVGTLDAALSNPSTIAISVVESLPTMLGGAGIARGLLGLGSKGLAAGAAGPVLPGLLARSFGSAAPLVAGAAGEGIIGAGSAAEQIREQQPGGTLTVKQVASALASGALTALLSVVGGKWAQKLGVVDIETALASGQLKPEALQKWLVKQLAGAGVSEGLLEELPQSAQEQVWQNIATEKPVLEGVANAAAMGLLAGAATGGGFQLAQYTAARGERKAQRAEQGAARLEELNKLAAASKVLKRDPETFTQFIESAIEGGDLQTVFIDGQTLMQSGMAEQLAAVSPSVAEQLQTVAQTGGAIAIPAAEYTTAIAPTEYAQALADHWITEADGFSRAQAQEYMQSRAEQLQQEVERTLAEKQGDEAFNASMESVKTRIRDEMDAMGRFDAAKNEADATLFASYYAVRAAQLGVTPEQFYEQRRVRFAAQSVGGQQFLMQSRDVVRDDDGDPVYFYHGGDADFTGIKPGGRFGGAIFAREGAPSGYGKNETKSMARQTGYDAVRTPDEFDGDTVMVLNNSAVVFHNALMQPKGANRGAFDSADTINKNAPTSDKSGSFAGLPQVGMQERAVRAVTGSPETGDSFNQSTQEFADAERAYGGKEAWEKARADGKTKLNFHQWVQVRTPEFKAWFGDWENDPENASKVINPKTGEPLVVYHGTNQNITAFDPARIGLRDAGFFGSGFYSTPDEGFAQDYADTAVEDTGEGEAAAMPLYVSLQNPFIWDMSDEGADATRAALAAAGIKRTSVRGNSAALGNAKEREIFNRAVREQGYDGVIVRDEDGIQEVVAFRPEQIKSATGNSGSFNPADANILHQGPRGSFNPQSLTITLLKGADLSTALHEGAHFFFENDIALASELVQQSTTFGADTMAEGERQIMADVSALFNQLGIKGTLQEQLAQWHTMDHETRRPHHEAVAEMFEAYLFEGKAPSLELAPYFQKFRAWMISVYKSVKAFLQGHPEAGKLDDTVRGVFDRMLATSDQIAMAEQARSMMPLLTDPATVGMTAQEFAAYQGLGTQATADAIEDLQARALRDMAYSRNARGREITRLQKQAAARRSQLRMQARREVMSQPVYRAWHFLTGRLSKDDKAAVQPEQRKTAQGLDPARDSLFVAIAKLGGLDREAVRRAWGNVDDKARSPVPVFGKPLLRREGGLSLDAMGELLAQHGYLPLDENGRFDSADLEERFDAELRGQEQFSIAKEYQGEQRAGEGADLSALGAGRLDLVALRGMGIPPEITGHVEALGMTAADGIHPDLVADLFEFSSGDELVRTLAAAQSPDTLIEDLTDQRMLEQHGDLATPDAIERAADAAIHNEVRARMVATEANALAKATGRPRILTSAAKEFAARLIARLKVRDIRPVQYANAAARAAKAARKALAAGDLKTAAAESRNQLIQLQAARAAYDAREEVDRGVRYLRKFQRAGVRKALDTGYLNQIDALLEKHDLQSSAAQADRRRSLSAWVQERLNAGEIPAIAENLLTPQERADYLAQVQSRDAAGDLIYKDDEAAMALLAQAVERSAKRSHKDMSVEEFRGLVETVKNIEHLGRLKDRLLTARDQKRYEAVRDEIAAGIVQHARQSGKNTKTANDWLGKKLQSIKSFGAAHIKVATWARIMDGGKDGGPVWRYLVQTANERATQETTLRAQATAALDAIMRPVLAKVPMADKVGKGKFFKSIGESLNWQERFAVALNIGNESNLQRLLGGKGWTFAQVKPVLDTLTAEEWRAVQAVWDHLETYRPLIGAKELRVSGVEPQWIAARGIEVNTADGQRLTLRGGYYPVVFDPRVNQKAEADTKAQEFKDLMKAAYSAATTRRGFTKQRVDELNGRPLLLNLQGLYSGVNDVIHDLSWHEWVIDANKLLRSRTIDNAIREHYGPEVKQQFEKWRDDIVMGTRRSDHAGELAAAFLRQSISASALTFNLMTAVTQPLGISNSVGRVGLMWVGKGIARYVGHPFSSTREAMAKSQWMANRIRTFFRELNELRNQVQGQTSAKEIMGRYGYWLMMRTQLMVDVPTWWGGYEKAIAEGHDEATAVQIANQGVKDSQGGGEEVDLAGIERGNAYAKLFTTFYSYMGSTLNTAFAGAKTARTKAGAAAHLALVTVVPTVLMTLLRDALVPGGGDDDGEELVKKLAAEQLSFLLGLFVVAREFSQASKLLFGEYSPGYGGPAGLRSIGDAYKLAQQASQGEFDDGFRKAFVSVLGDLTGLPAVQINKTWTGAEAVSEGKTETPVESAAALAFGFQR